MNCPKCGNQVPDGAAMCPNCNYVFPYGLRPDGEPSHPGVPFPRRPGQPQQPQAAPQPQQPAPTRPALPQSAPQPQAAPAQPAYQQPQAAPPPQPQAAPPPQQQMPQAQMPPQAAPGGVIPGIIQERSPVTLIILGMVTCGIYIWYWWYKSTQELKEATGDQSLNPGMDLLLVVLTGGLWGVYIEHRNAKKVHEILVQRDPGRKDQSQTILIMRIVGLFIAFTAFYAMYLTQQEYNAMAQTYG